MRAIAKVLKSVSIPILAGIQGRNSVCLVFVGVVGEASDIHIAGSLPDNTVKLLANADQGRFGGLFKPSWQSKSADKRLAAAYGDAYRRYRSLYPAIKGAMT